jgi:hypothetical protein
MSVTNLTMSDFKIPILLRQKFTIGLLLAVLGMQFVAPAYGLDAEEKLQAIKQVLVDLAMQKDVKLGSSAYLDSGGVLHESSIMSTQTEVRGIRVIQYLEEAGVPGASMQSAMISSRSCLGSQAGLRREATIQTMQNSVATSPGIMVGDHSVGEISELLKSQLSSVTTASAQWSTTENLKFQSDYMRYLAASAVDKVPYSFVIELRILVPNHSNFSSTRATLRKRFSQIPVIGNLSSTHQRLWPEVTLEYQLTLVEKATNRELWQGKRELTYPGVSRGYRKDAFPEQLIAYAKNTTELFVKQATLAMDCHSDHYPLVAIAGDDQRRTINAGAIAGLRVGDQFLISPSDNILQQVISLSGMSKLGLARVEAVSPHRATLVHIAGPKWTSKDSVSKGFAIYF